MNLGMAFHFPSPIFFNFFNHRLKDMFERIGMICLGETNHEVSLNPHIPTEYGNGTAGSIAFGETLAAAETGIFGLILPKVWTNGLLKCEQNTPHVGIFSRHLENIAIVLEILFREQKMKFQHYLHYKPNSFKSLKVSPVHSKFLNSSTERSILTVIRNVKNYLQQESTLPVTPILKNYRNSKLF